MAALRPKAMGIFLCAAVFPLFRCESNQGAPDLESELRPYLESYCISCHGEKKQKGDRRWDTLVLPINDTLTLLHVQEILDILNLGEMPPIEEEEQPRASETKRIVELLTATLDERYTTLKSTGQQTVFRRLNRREYRNTIRDLLHIDTTSFDPTQSFPRDQTDHHLDTIGDQLVTSAYLLDQYLEAADQIIEKVFADSERPPQKTGDRSRRPTLWRPKPSPTD
jgi:hypothetical protein